MISKIVKLFSNIFMKKKGWINKTPIDQYIDRFFIINCPETVSISHVESQTYNLFHRIFLQVNEQQNEEPKESTNASVDKEIY